MALPNYGTDLTTVAIGSITVDTGTWDESSDGAYDDGGTMVDDGNLYYNGTKCVSAQFTKTGMGSIMYGHGSAITVPTNGAILLHHLWAAPPALLTFASGGVRALIGNSFGDFKVWYVSGSDRAPAPNGGWYQYAIDPSLTGDVADIGSPSGVLTHFGIAVNASAQTRGNPNAANAVRYGRCEAIYTLGEIANPAIFSGFALVDNAAANKYGLLKDIDGGYKHQGLASFGTVANAVYFEDLNTNINIENTEKVTSSFNRFEVVNATSTLKWTAISISSLGTVSRGEFEMIDNATVQLTSCTFTDMSTWIFQSNAVLDSTTFRRTNQITQGGATFTDCIFDKLTSAVSVVVSALADITECTFNSDGSNHAVNLGTVSADVTMSWNNLLNDYAAIDGSTGNEAILVDVDSGITLTINVVDGATTPFVNNVGLGTVNVVAGQKTFKFTLNPSMVAYEWRIYSVTAAGSLVGAVELAGEETAIADNQTYTYSYTVDTTIAVQILGVNYVDSPTFYVLKNANQDVVVNLKIDNNN